jgi:diguanylate cyclase (GGDEF)-like protein
MRIQPAGTAFIDWLSRSIPDRKFHFELVRALYSTPKSIAGASIAAALIVGTSAIISGDPYYFAILAGFVIVGAGRSASIMLYRRSNYDPNDHGTTKRWELIALLGAYAFAALVGLTGAYTLMMHSDTELEILVSGCVLGYIAGISSRNAARPIISIGQITLTCVPFMAALLLERDLVHGVLATFIGVLYVSTIVMCRSVFDNIVSKHDAYGKIEIIAQHDALTGLWNRTAFLQLLEQNLRTMPQTGNKIGLISIDLDGFKDINDSLGHPAGDAILKQVATRICEAVGPRSEVARIGGDEFLVMCAGPSPNVGALARDVLATFSAPFAINMSNYSCGASIGYATAPDDGTTLDLLLRNADLALYEAKKGGRARVIPYTAALAKLYEDRIALENDLQFALANGEFDLVYQPIVDPRSGRAICCEALLRWNHPERGMISPAVFIPIAEATGLINSIGAWVLRAACIEATHWASDIKVAVNLSPVQFRRGRELVDIVMSALVGSGLAARRLDLEVTESVLIEDTASTLAVLEELRSKDIGVSLDDFGTGFASLSYLNDFPFSKVKIDRKFSQNIDQSTRTAAIITGVAQITHDLRIELVAEGIETENQLTQMRSFGINAIQGYLYSKPLPVQQLRRIISEPIVPGLAKAKRVAPVVEGELARRAS